MHVGLRLLLDEQVHIVREVQAEGRYRLENVQFGGWITLDEGSVSRYWVERRLRFEIHGAGVRKDSTDGLCVNYVRADFEALAPNQQEIAWERYRLLEALCQSSSKVMLKMLTRQKIAAFLDKQEEQIASVYTVERWLKSFVESGGDIRSLIPLTDQRGGKGQSRLHPDVEQIVQGVMMSCQQNPMQRTADQVYARILTQIADENVYRREDDCLKAPSRATFYRRLAQAGQCSVLQRQTSRSQRHKASGVEHGPRPTRLLERVEIDHTPLHLFVVDMEDRLPIGRPTLTLATDSTSKMPVGFDLSFHPGSYLSVMRCLRHGILPKEDCQTVYGTKNPFPVYGLPETIVVDRGKEFVGNSLSNALAMLGVIHEVMPGRTPWYKGSIERFFRTQNTGLLAGLPGYTFGDIFSRGEYNPAEDACISLETLCQLLHIFLLDIYAQRWHEGIEDIPARRWEAGCKNGFAPTLYHDVEEIQILLCASEERTLTRQGIAWETLQYNSHDLSRLRLRMQGERVRFRYDPEDLGVIYVFDPDVGWLTVPAVHPEYAQGLSLYKHRVIRQMVLADKRASVDIYALAQARVRLQELVAHEFTQTRRQQGRKQMARLLEHPIPSVKAPMPHVLPEDLALPAKDDAAGWSGDYNLPVLPQKGEGNDG